MHAFGGLYIDLDVQCFRSAEPSLLGHDIVLQSEYREGRDIVNSIMASVPGHPFWKAVITEMLEASLLSQLDGILRKWELSCSISFTHQVPQGRGYSMLVQEYVQRVWVLRLWEATTPSANHCGCYATRC